MKHAITILLLLFTTITQGQNTIKGLISEQPSGTPIDHAIVMLYDEQSNKIIAYQNSNQAGEFAFENLNSEQIYRIEASKMGYSRKSQQIILAQQSKQSIVVKIELTQKDFQLEGITIEANKPIVVKKDTIIYNIEKLTQLHDSTLDEVLGRIRGIEMTPNGGIRVQGKDIDKVLVNGKEISNFGTALLTKSVPADKVKSVEVRFDEQNKKIKESILKDEQFAVLDIQLKGGDKPSFFGNMSLSAGYQHHADAGGYANLFSLGKKSNIQLFAENNNYKQNKIRIDDIKNIGQEALDEIFSTPTDIDDVKKRESYQSGFYGFDANYTNHDNAIAGLSVNVPLSQQTDLYVGAFASYSYLSGTQKNHLYLAEKLIDQYAQSQLNLAYQSKSKVEIKHTSEQLKSKTNANFVSIHARNAQHTESHFKKNNTAYEFYANHSLEYLLSEKWGIAHKMHFTDENLQINTQLHRPTLAMAALTGEHFTQKNLTGEQAFKNDVLMSYRNKDWGTHQAGYRLEWNEAKDEKTSDNPHFATPEQKVSAHTHSATYQVSHQMLLLYLNAFVAHSWVIFPNISASEEAISQRENRWQYKLSADVSLPALQTLQLSWNKYLGAFPLRKLMEGQVLTGFQHLYHTDKADIRPYYNTDCSIVAAMELNHNTDWHGAYVQGISENLNNQQVRNGIIHTHAHQLRTDYHLFSTKVKSRLGRLSVEATPEMLRSSSAFENQEGIYRASTHTYMASLGVEYRLKGKLQASYYPKYTHFLFQNDLAPVQEKFNFLTNDLELTGFFWQEKLKANCSYLYIHSFSSDARFHHLNGSLAYQGKNIKLQADFYNILGAKHFTAQSQEHNLRYFTQSEVFGRYVQLSVSFKINGKK